MNTTTCPTCGARIRVSDWPWCPHGPTALVVVPDDIPGGRRIDSLGITVHSRSQLRAELQARGLQPCVKHEGGHEGDRSAHTQRFVSVDLEAARVLAERQAQTTVRHVPNPDAPSAKTIAQVKIAWEIAAARK